MNVWVILLPFFVWLVVLTYYLYKTVDHYQRLVQRTNRDNLTEILDKILEELNLNKTKIAELRETLQKQIEQSIGHIQKVGVLRFNPFADTGGDQSFVLAILDGKDCGVVLTSLHSRGSTRWYAKNVKDGKGVDHKLSEEEEKAITNANII
ncbi:DUF4446 family protein [Candidatus Gottesmanbacteria bacterium]|nr:DUF4446 family protein [Candidatus Gottesmanbacteria bacterium]